MQTDTIPGFFADAASYNAIRMLYRLKGRPGSKPLQVMVDSLQQAEKLAVFDEKTRALAGAFWPGPLTLVLPRKVDAPISPLAVQGRDTIGLRIPDSPHLLAFLKRYGRPVVATSANKSGQPTMTLEEVRLVYPHLPVLESRVKTRASKIASTVVELREGEIRILREGGITKVQISSILAG